MAKGQQRSGREAKKPKASKTVVAPPSGSSSLPRPVKTLPHKGDNK